MLLAIDVGNSNNVIGLFSGDKLLTHWRIRTEWTRTSDEYWVLIKEFILLNVFNKTPENSNDIKNALERVGAALRAEAGVERGDRLKVVAQLLPCVAGATDLAVALQHGHADAVVR